MNRAFITDAIGRIDDRHVAEAARFGDGGMAPSERNGNMQEQTYKTYRPRRRGRALAVAAAVAALLMALSVTAYAAGWLDSIFGQAAGIFNTNDETEDRIEAAAAAVSQSPQEPERQELPAFDGSALTLKESWYDGKGLLLGVDLEAAKPDPVIGYEPDGALLEHIMQDNLTYGFAYSTAEDLERLRRSIEENYQGTADYDALMAQLDRQEALLAAGDPDDLDVELEVGYITQEQYDDTMSLRTQRGADAGLHYESAILLDTFLEQKLTGEEYDELWQALERDGAVCVAMQDVYLSDHLLAEGEDIVAVSTDVEAGTFIQAQTPTGNEGHLSADLPEALQNLDELHIQLKVKGCPVYYYMRLDGRAYSMYEQSQSQEQLVPFTIKNSAK